MRKTEKVENQTHHKRKKEIFEQRPQQIKMKEKKGLGKWGTVIERDHDQLLVF